MNSLSYKIYDAITYDFQEYFHAMKVAGFISNAIFFCALILLLGYVFRVIFWVDFAVRLGSRKVRKQKSSSINISYTAQFSKKTRISYWLFVFFILALECLLTYDICYGYIRNSIYNYIHNGYFEAVGPYPTTGPFTTFFLNLFSGNIIHLPECFYDPNYIDPYFTNTLLVYINNIIKPLIIIAFIGPTMILLYLYYRFGIFNESIKYAYIYVGDEEVLIANPGVTRAKLQLSEIESIEIGGYTPSFHKSKQVEW